MKTGFTILLFGSLVLKVSGSPVASSGFQSLSPKVLRAAQWARAKVLLESQIAGPHGSGNSEDLVDLESRKYEKLVGGEFIQCLFISPTNSLFPG